MAKTRVYELAKELGVESKTVLSTLKDMGEFVRSASSTIEPPVERRLKEKFGSDGSASKPAAKSAAPSPADRGAGESHPGSPTRPAAPAPSRPGNGSGAPATRSSGGSTGGAPTGSPFRPGPRPATPGPRPAQTTSHRLRPRRLRPSRPRPPSAQAPSAPATSVEPPRAAQPSAPRHRVSRRPSSRRPRGPPRRRVPVPYRGRRVSPVRGRTSVRTSVVASRPLGPTSPVVPTVRRVPRRRLDPPPQAPPVRDSPAHGRVPVAPAVCPAARRVRVDPAAHRVRVTTRSPPPRAWDGRDLPARPAAMRLRVDLVRPPAVVAPAAVPVVPVGLAPVVVAVCPACRARTRP